MNRRFLNQKVFKNILQMKVFYDSLFLLLQESLILSFHNIAAEVIGKFLPQQKKITFLVKHLFGFFSPLTEACPELVTAF